MVNPWVVLRPYALFWLGFVVMGLAVLALRVYRLDSLQSEVYGDIHIVHEYVAQILRGEWPTLFVLSSGPLYHYLITPVAWLGKNDYTSLKAASVLVSLGILATTYACARRLVDDWFALLATFITGVSSWLLIFSRLGNSQILVPVLSMGMLYFIVRIGQYDRNADYAWCGAISALGLYGYPQSFVLPGVALATLLVMRKVGHPVSMRGLRWFALVAAVCALPFVVLVWRDPSNFFSGYIGGKINTDTNPLAALATNLWNGLLAFHVRGDVIYRSNPSMVPHLDPISGVLMLLGLGFWLQNQRRRWFPVLMIPFVLLQLPSLLVLGRPTEVPSASRSIAMAPIAYILVASGLWWLWQIGVRRVSWRWLVSVGAVAVLVAVLVLNMQRYFGAYIDGLPYSNTPVGQLIGAHADSLPDQTTVYIVGCCWAGDMPDPKFVRLMMHHPEKLQTLAPDTLTCSALQQLPQPATLIWSYAEPLPAPALVDCQEWLPAEVYSSPAGLPAFHAAPLRISGAMVGREPLFTDSALQGAIVATAGQNATVFHSPLEGGSTEAMFDGDLTTTASLYAGNPTVIDIQFPEPQATTLVGIDLATHGGVDVVTQVTYADGQTTREPHTFIDLPPDAHIDLALSEPQVPITRIRIEMLDQHGGNVALFVVRDISFQ